VIVGASTALSSGAMLGALVGVATGSVVVVTFGAAAFGFARFTVFLAMKMPPKEYYSYYCIISASLLI
jgi:hypothetical protein